MVGRQVQSQAGKSIHKSRSTGFMARHSHGCDIARNEHLHHTAPAWSEAPDFFFNGALGPMGTGCRWRSHLGLAKAIKAYECPQGSDTTLPQSSQLRLMGWHSLNFSFCTQCSCARTDWLKTHTSGSVRSQIWCSQDISTQSTGSETFLWLQVSRPMAAQCPLCLTLV